MSVERLPAMLAEHPPSEHVQIGEQYYILASTLASRGHRLLLNHGDSFAIFDEAGDVPFGGRDIYGLFCRGTRYLSRFELRLNEAVPLILNAAPTDDASELSIYLTNGDERRGGEVVMQRDTVAIRRRAALADGMLINAIQLHNYGRERLALRLRVAFAADFADVFELRGVERADRGTLRQAELADGCVRLPYEGLDGEARITELRFTPVGAWRLSGGLAELALDLAPRQSAAAEIVIQCRFPGAAARPQHLASAVGVVAAERRQCLELFPEIETDNEEFNDWLRVSIRDLAILRTVGARGSYLYAGIPWFATVFGRDGLLTAREVLAFAPELAAGTLRTLAALQGTRDDPERDEEPGKILHEVRHGEMAALGEVPFGRYYGSIDATPLFLMLLADYAERTADLDLVSALWPSARAAMAWIDRASGPNGYLAYARRTHRGLGNQGWKDSHDSVSHADGRLAEPPIALCEVQAYVYAARRGLAALARRLDEPALAEEWEGAAAALRARFERDFWMEDRDTYALALDGAGARCEVVASNPGHCLFGGIVEAPRASRVVDRLLREDCSCGWGIRTLSSEAPRYNPMSYHNGSVWPHDNAIIAAGFGRYGLAAAAAAVLSALFEATAAMEERSLPELFCGFPRSERQQPVPYPVACRPQAWAAGAVFLLLEAVLGLQMDAWERRVTISHATLPAWLRWIELRGLRLADARVDLRVTRGRYSAAVEVTGRAGDIEVVVRK